MISNISNTGQGHTRRAEGCEEEKLGSEDLPCSGGRECAERKRDLGPLRYKDVIIKSRRNMS